MRKSACVFVGRHRISPRHIEIVVKRLNSAIDTLARNGVTDFISLGKKGFDLLAAALVLARRESGMPVRLIVAMPRTDLLRLSPAPDRDLLYRILNEADKVLYTTEKPIKLVFDHASVCLCYFPGIMGLRIRRLLKNHFVINVAYTV